MNKQTVDTIMVQPFGTWVEKADTIVGHILQHIAMGTWRKGTSMDMKEIRAGEITAEIIEQQADAWKKATEEAKEASGAYTADLEARKAALVQRAAEYQKQIEDLGVARKKRAEEVNDLTSRDRFDEAVEAEFQVERLDRTITMLERKIQLVSSAEMKGDSGCYGVAKQAHEKAENERQKCADALSQLYHTAQTEISRLREILTRISNMSSYVRSYGPDDGFDAVDRHFRDLDRIEREARERWQAEEAAKKVAGNRAKVQIVLPQ